MQKVGGHGWHGQVYIVFFTWTYPLCFFLYCLLCKAVESTPRKHGTKLHSPEHPVSSFSLLFPSMSFYHVMPLILTWTENQHFELHPNHNWTQPDQYYNLQVRSGTKTPAEPNAGMVWIIHILVHGYDDRTQWSTYMVSPLRITGKDLDSRKQEDNLFQRGVKKVCMSLCDSHRDSHHSAELMWPVLWVFKWRTTPKC